MFWHYCIAFLLTREQLEYLIDHYRIVGQINNILEVSEHLKKVLLESAQLQLMEDALSQATSKSFKGRQQHFQVNNF